MRFASRAAAACFIVALPVFLITSNIRILASDADYYKHGFREFGAAQATGLPLSELDRAASDIVRYFADDSATLHIIVTQDGQEVSLFNSRETQHMEDVKSLIQNVYRLQEISMVIVLSYVALVFLWAREKPLRTLAVQSLAGVGLGIGVIGIVGVLALTGFDSTWTKFHEIAFSNNLWQLNPATDHLIQMFPEGFWEEATFIVAALTVAETLVVVSASLTYLVVTRQRSERRPPARTGRAPVPASDGSTQAGATE